MGPISKADYRIKSVDLACALLEQFRGGDLSISELSRALGINKNNVFRLLATLELRSFIEKNPASGSYQIGIANLKLGEACIRSKEFVEEAHPSLADIAGQSRETALLAVLGEGGLVCEDAVTSSLPVRVIAEVGISLPLNRTAAGKVMLACGNEELQKKLLRGEDPGYGAQPAKLTKELLRIRKMGYAVSFGAFKSDVCAVAAPVRNHAAEVIGAISIVAPSYRFTPEMLNEEIAPLVVRAAREVSLKMGFMSLVEMVVASLDKNPHRGLPKERNRPRLSEKSTLLPRKPSVLGEIGSHSRKLKFVSTQIETVAA